MDTKQSGVTLSLNRLIAFLVAGGFLFLFVETLIEHNEVMSENFIAYAPILFSAFGLVLALLAAIKWQQKWIRILHVYMFLALFTGLGGLFFHNKERVLTKETLKVEALEDEEYETAGEKKDEHAPPILAPMAFAGLGAVGLLGTFRRWQAEVIVKNN